MIEERVFLHKNLAGPGFEILDETMKLIYKDLQFVWMKDVTFIICEKNKQITMDTGQKTIHAWIEGILVDALPIYLKLKPSHLPYLKLGLGISYKPMVDRGFILDSTGEVIEIAKELFAYNGKVRVIC